MKASQIISALLSLSIGLCCGCAKRSLSTSGHTETTTYSYAASARKNQARLNINTASAKELEALPGIGKGLAAHIVEHREKFGPFRRAEDLIIVRGISDRRFRALRDLITAE